MITSAESSNPLHDLPTNPTRRRALCNRHSAWAMREKRARPAQRTNRVGGIRIAQCDLAVITRMSRFG